MEVYSPPVMLGWVVSSLQSLGIAGYIPVLIVIVVGFKIYQKFFGD